MALQKEEHEQGQESVRLESEYSMELMRKALE